MHPEDWPAARWFSDFQNDFAARLQWSVHSEYSAANHHPRVRIREGLVLTRPAGASVTLSAEVSDPDGDTLEMVWWQYREAGSSSAEPELSLSGETVEFSIPADALPGETLHLLCTARDNGTPPLGHHARVVITVGPKEY